jgi:oxygen-independent coproporphyrinogen-3 oxidase
MRDLEILSGFEGVGHVSAYQMTVEPQTAFGKQQAKGRLRVPDEDQTYEMLEEMRNGLELLGFQQYEVSSYARDGQEGRHNQNYWAGGEYLGVGMGAHSFEISAGYVRRTNTRSLKQYMTSPTASSSSEELNAIEHLRERLFLGVRSSVGVDVETLKQQFTSVEDTVFEDIQYRLNALERRGWLHFEGRYKPTRSGFMFSDSMAESLYEVG